MTNYQKALETLIAGLRHKPRLLLHACCAPCATYVLEYLSPHFEITVFYYNPNISPQSEHDLRLQEARRTAAHFGAGFVETPWRPEEFERAAKGLEDAPEGGARCTGCFGLRLQKTAQLARAGGYDYFATTLTISPLKDAQLLNRLGEEAGLRQGVAHLPGDFKKKEGYKRSIQLSAQLGLYRQSYCGCKYSKKEV